MKAPVNEINFNGRDWAILRAYLKEMVESKTGLIVRDCSHDEANKLRGALMVLSQLLNLEKDANRPQ